MLCYVDIKFIIVFFSEWRWRYYWLCQYLRSTRFWSPGLKKSHYQGFVVFLRDHLILNG